MQKRKRRLRRLSNLDIVEVSWVDKPANQTPFLFVKNEDGINMDNAEDIDKRFTGLDFRFKTDGTPDNTKVIVNGNTIQNLTDVNLSYYPIDSTDVGNPSALGLRLMYTVKTRGTTSGGFQSTRTYRLSKGEDKLEITTNKANKEDIDILKKLHSDINEDMDGTLAKALAEQATIIDAYKDDLPAALRDSITNIVKVATETEMIEEDNTMRKEDEKTETEEQTAPVVDTDKIIEALGPAIESGINTALDAREVKAEEARQAAKDEETKTAEALQEARELVASADGETKEEESPADEEKLIEVDEEELNQEALQDAINEQAATGSVT